MRRLAGSLLLVVAGLSLAACGGDGYGSSSGNTTGSQGATGDTVAGGGAAGAGDAAATIANFSFSVPGPVAAGTAFTVKNSDGVTHTFTNPDGAFDVKVGAGETAEVTIATAGTYNIVCKIHGQMKGTITAT